MNGIGIPDLIEVFPGPQGVVLRVGDIKGSRTPHYRHTWQVAYYARLLDILVRDPNAPLAAEVARTGFLLTRAASGEEGIVRHTFDLEPFLTAFPALQRTIARTLCRPRLEDPAPLGPWCAGCPWFDHCYQEALERHDMLFVPGLRRGLVDKLLLRGVHTLEALSSHLSPPAEEPSVPRSPDALSQSSVAPDSQASAAQVSPSSFEIPAAAGTASAGDLEFPVLHDIPPEHLDVSIAPEHRKNLEIGVEALRTGRVYVKSTSSRLFPRNLSRAFLVDVVVNPLTAQPLGWAFATVGADGGPPTPRVWVPGTEEDPDRHWAVFCQAFLDAWRRHAGQARGPHVFYFGSTRWRTLGSFAAESPLAFLWAPGHRHATDLREVLKNHFCLPVPGMLSAYAIEQVLGLDVHFDAPESLLHGDGPPKAIVEGLLAGVRGEDGGEHGETDSVPSGQIAGSGELPAGSTPLGRVIADHLERSLAFQAKLLAWVRRHVSSDWDQTTWEVSRSTAGARAFQDFLEEERRLREADVLALQRLPLSERVERFRAVGPLRFVETSLDEEGRFRYHLSVQSGQSLSKFRQGDFLKLAPLNGADIQEGAPVILAEYARREGQVLLLSRQGRLNLNPRIAYSLEEDLTDFTFPRLTHVVETVFSQDAPHPLSQLLEGRWPLERDPDEGRGIDAWLDGPGRVAGLNAMQTTALRLPFRSRLSLIEGPPGTGKTHLLGWILLALVEQARARGVPARIAVSALTHQAIDHVLAKVVALVNRHRGPRFPARCFKYGGLQERSGEPSPGEDGQVRVETFPGVDAVRTMPYLILGATGFGLYKLFGGAAGAFPSIFDWVVFDEASQILVPQALLSLVFGRGNYIFLGDVHQLPPIVLARSDDAEVPKGVGGLEGPDTSGTWPPSAPLEPAERSRKPDGRSLTAKSATSRDTHKSILELLMDRYGEDVCVTLEETYRMNREICAFPSRFWYGGRLRPAAGNAGARLALDGPRRGDLVDRILDPEKPVVLVLARHWGARQASTLERNLVVALAERLLEDHGIDPEAVTILSPHRAQNNAIRAMLEERLGPGASLPLIDTVERAQGAERDVVLYSLTASDPDTVSSSFLNNPNRFNVAITRARKKLVVVGSPAFFDALPNSEDDLAANACFKAFRAMCGGQGSVFVCPEGGIG